MKGREVGFAIMLNRPNQGAECTAFARRGSPAACNSPHAERSQQGRRLKDWGRSSQKRVKPLIRKPISDFLYVHNTSQIVSLIFFGIFVKNVFYDFERSKVIFVN